MSNISCYDYISPAMANFGKFMFRIQINSFPAMANLRKSMLQFQNLDLESESRIKNTNLEPRYIVHLPWNSLGNHLIHYILQVVKLIVSPLWQI